MAKEFAVELGEKNYGSVHAAGCRDLEDGEPVGTDYRMVHVELWPENEPMSREEFMQNAKPCAKALLVKLETLEAYADAGGNQPEEWLQDGGVWIKS